MGHVLAAYLTASSGGGAGGLLIIYIILYFVFAFGVYGAYKKAGSYGDPPWAAFIPIYNFIVLLKVAGRPMTWAWFLLLAIIPFVGSLALLVVSIIILHDVSKSFGHGGAFTVGLVLLAPIFWYILWLGPSQYRGPAALAGGYGNAAGTAAATAGLRRWAAIRRHRPATPPLLHLRPARHPPRRRPGRHRHPRCPAIHPWTPDRPPAGADAATAVADGIAGPKAWAGSGSGQDRSAVLWFPRGTSSPGGAVAKVSRMASASARAEAGSSSTATRAAAPRDGLSRSMFNVWSALAWTGWSK